MIRRAICCLLYTLCILAAVTFARNAPADEIKTGFQERVFRDEAGEHKYMLFIPATYTAERKWPVILYLHGSSARGTDNKLPLVGGLAPQVRAREASFPFIVVFPQCEDRDTRLLDGWLASTADGRRALKILDAVESELSVDPQHEILTGWSMGGVGAYSLAALSPSRWSALVVVAGSGDASTAADLKTIPIWAFHGTRDFTVPFEEGQRMLSAVKEAGGRAWFTELTKVRHNIAHVVYGEDSLYEWMLDPGTEPRPESIVRNTQRAPNESEMGHDFVHAFVPAVEIPQALYLRMDKEAIESLAYALPDMVPEGALAGFGPDVHQSRRAFLTRFNITLSGINYRGTLERVAVTPQNDGWVTIALGLRNMTMEVGSTQINGRMVSATAGPMQIVIGHQAPAWLRMRVRPYVEGRRLRIEPGNAQFEIADDNWYVTTPQVVTRGIPIMRRRVSNQISSSIVQGTYGRKGEIEAQVVQNAPALVQKLQELLDQNLGKTRALGSWPMPAYQPPFQVWADRLKVDESGLALTLGITVGRPALDNSVEPVRRVERPPVNFDEMPKQKGMQIGISGAFLEGFTSVVVNAGVAMADALDLHAPEFHQLSDPRLLVEAIPDLARYGDRLQVRTRIRALEPMLFSAAPASANGDSSTPVPPGAVQLRMPHLRISVDIKTSPEQAAWERCAQFDMQLAQRFDLQIQKPDFEKRVIHLSRPQEAEISVTGQFAGDYMPSDMTLHSDRITDLFRNAWRASERMELLQEISASDLAVGTAKLRAAEVKWCEPFLLRRYVPARTRITNRGVESFTYSVKGPFTEWGGPYTLAPGKSHDFAVPYRLTVRPAAPVGLESYTLQMGTDFVFSPNLDRTIPPTIATDPDSNNERQ